MDFREIGSHDIPHIADFASESFADDPFYHELSDNRHERKKLLADIFIKSIRICVDHGIALGLVEGGQYIAFVIAFDYSHLRECHPGSFDHIFMESSRNGKLNEKLTSQLDSINDKYIGDSKEYLYLLAVAVRESHRRKGLATALIQTIQKTYPHYNLFTDISNQHSIPLYRKLGFEILEEAGGCTLVRHLSGQDAIELDYDCLKLAVPFGLDTERLFGRELTGEVVKLDGLKVIQSETPFFVPSCTESAKALLIPVTYADLLIYQRHINVLCFTEIKRRTPDNKGWFLIYLSGCEHYKGLEIDPPMRAILDCKRKEWDIIPDCYVSIPVMYDDVKLMDTCAYQHSFLVNRIMTAMAFRTHYESGIPIKMTEGRGFKERIKRMYLGDIRIQIYSESQVVFNGVPGSNTKICEPVDVSLIMSIDTSSKSGVLHMVSLSSGLLLSQFLDSVSRNQISVITDEGVVNLYTYLDRHFKIYKKGSAKSFLTVPKSKKDIPEDLMASLLFCETFYEDAKVLGKVVDEDITQLLANEHGIAQYDYASVYTYSNILLQASEGLVGSLTDRIVRESITLFYIELLLFEEAAIHIANDEIIRFLTQLDQYSPGTVLKNINTIISDHVKSIDFWDIQMNYPSSKKSVDDIRASFKIEHLRSIIQRNLDQLLMIYNTRSDIVDKTETSILTTIGAVLTTLSIMSLLSDPKQQMSLVIAALTVGIFILVKNFIFRRAMKRKKKA